MSSLVVLIQRENEERCNVKQEGRMFCFLLCAACTVLFWCLFVRDAPGALKAWLQAAESIRKTEKRGFGGRLTWSLQPSTFPDACLEHPSEP
eukprot:1067922-Pelagomonas_calceolata.AAC.5